MTADKVKQALNFRGTGIAEPEPVPPEILPYLRLKRLRENGCEGSLAVDRVNPAPVSDIIGSDGASIFV